MQRGGAPTGKQSEWLIPFELSLNGKQTGHQVAPRAVPSLTLIAGYPPGDVLPYDFLCRDLDAAVPERVPAYQRAVFKVTRYLTALVDQAINIIKSQPHLREPSNWSEYLRDFDKKPQDEKNLREIFFELVDRRARHTPAPLDLSQATKKFADSMIVLSAIVQGGANEAPVILFLIDEAHELETGVGTVALGSSMANLLSSMHAVPHLLVVSTTASKL